MSRSSGQHGTSERNATESPMGDTACLKSADMGFEPRSLWPYSPLFLLHNIASFRLIPHWFRNLALYHPSSVYACKCSHSLLRTIANSAANNGQVVLTLPVLSQDNLTLFSVAPIFLHALPPRLTCGPHCWKCWVCTEATRFCSPLWDWVWHDWSWLAHPQAKQDLCSTLVLPLSLNLPCPMSLQHVCCGGAQLLWRSRTDALRWTTPQLAPTSLAPLPAKPALWGRWTRQGSEFPWIIHECAPTPLKSQVNPRSNFSFPLKRRLSISLGSGRFTI